MLKESEHTTTFYLFPPPLPKELNGLKRFYLVNISRPELFCQVFARSVPLMAELLSLTQWGLQRKSARSLLVRIHAMNWDTMPHILSISGG